MTKHIVSGSDGISLHFQTTEEYKEYKHETLLLDLSFYAKLRITYGIFASNQNKFVALETDLNEWDSKYMEKMLFKHYVELVKRGLV